MKPIAIIIALQWALLGWAGLHDPHGRTHPPWLVYEAAAATSQTGPHLEGFGTLQGGSRLSLRGWKLPAGAPCLLILGSARDDLTVGTGRLVPRPEKVVGRKAQSNGCWSYDVDLPATVPATGKIHVQLFTKVGGKSTLTNAITLDFGKNGAP